MELCVRIIDQKTSGDATLDSQSCVRGDVLDVLPDGADWGKEVVSHPEVRILKVPDMTKAEAEAYKTEQNPGQDYNRKFLWRRQFKINLDHPSMSAVTSSKEGSKLTFTTNDLRAVKVSKSAQTNPFIIG